MKSHLSRRPVLLAALACVVPVFTSCGGGRESSSAGGSLDRVAWLGSSEGWGLLGLPLGGGPLTYLSAENLESPTWAPPELGRIVEAWPGDGVIWVQFADTRIGLYDYSTGHILSFDSLGARTPIAVALGGETAVVVTPDEARVELAGVTELWQFALGGSLAGLKSARPGRIVAAVAGEPQAELVVFEPPAVEPLARRQVGAVLDFVVTPSGERLYYVSGNDADLTVHGLVLPELEDAEEYTLPEPAQALAITPSGHRLYVAAGTRLHVFDRLRGRPAGEVALPGVAAALRFGVNGANLLARLDSDDQIAVLQVGVDSVIGVFVADWDAKLPVSLPGGRLVARGDTSLLLYDIPRLIEVGRTSANDGLIWLAVDWQPPRPRIELADRRSREPTPAPTVSASASRSGAGEATEDVVAAGFYAVVLAARQRAGVDELVSWLRSVEYPAIVDLHRDAMGVEWFRAMVGPYANREQAESTAQTLASRYGYKPWILHQEQEKQPSEPLQSAADTVANADGDPAGVGGA